MAKPHDKAPDSEALEQVEQRPGKGRATPTRREREAARKRPLIPDDRGMARKESRKKLQEARERARVGMANGEERYLPTRDKGPQKRFVRDYVDARFSVGEMTIPLMLGVIVLTFFPSMEVQFFGIVAMWAFMLVAVIDSVVLGLVVKRKLAIKFGESRVERGVRWYAAMRALQFRPLRLPKPQVKRGKYPA